LAAEYARHKKRIKEFSGCFNGAAAEVIVTQRENTTMPIDSARIGSNERQIVVIGDPTNASNQLNLMVLTDALPLGGFAALGGAVTLLVNGSGLGDRMRSAAGTTGVLAVNTEGTKATYSVGIVGFAPAATATDFFNVAGSASKTVRVTRVQLSGVASSAASVAIQLIRRSSLNTGGTPASATPLAHDTNDTAATATVASYGANPTLGSAVGTHRAQQLNLGSNVAGTITWDFTLRNAKGLALRGTAQSLSLNWGGAAVPGGTSLAIDVEFTEE
jgi:hypothetical protein